MGDQQKNTQEPDVNQLRKVRREKLADLQANGKNPFEITKYDVTCHATDIQENFEEMEGKHVSVKSHIRISRNWISEISLVLKVKYSRLRPVRFLSMHLQ